MQQMGPQPKLISQKSHLEGPKRHRPKGRRFGTADSASTSTSSARACPRPCASPLRGRCGTSTQSDCDVRWQRMQPSQLHGHVVAQLLHLLPVARKLRAQRRQ